MRQAQLALATGVGRRFLIELEAGKPSCQLGRSLLVAQALGLHLQDLLGNGDASHAAIATELEDLPELPDELEAAQ
jgi:DNA-binding XRE family transcriptional regulator